MKDMPGAANNILQSDRGPDIALPFFENHGTCSRRTAVRRPERSSYSKAAKRTHRPPEPGQTVVYTASVQWAIFHESAHHRILNW